MHLVPALILWQPQLIAALVPGRRAQGMAVHIFCIGQFNPFPVRDQYLP